jgi:trigger factor
VKKQVATPAEAEVDEAITRMASPNRPFQAKDGPAETRDRVVVDFVGTIEGEAFEGGTAEGITVEIGSGSFIPGFEEQLVGATAGQKLKVNVTFPPNYGAAHLAGKPAEFDVTVKEVQAAGEVAIDDELAKGFGMDSLDKLRDAVKGAIQRDYDAQARRKLKKELLDALDTKYTFELPPSLVEQEFAAVWSQVEADMKSNGKTFADESTTEDEARAEYRRIAERRVRLGLVLAQVGEKADIKVADDEVTKALVERVRQYPGQEKQVWEFYQKNPQALAEVRAPLFEEKVVDHVLGQVKVAEEPVSKEQLFADDDDAADAKAKTEATA